MPGERTAYRKLQVLLDYAKTGKHGNTKQLAEHVGRRAPTNFAYYYRDRETDEVVKETSIRSIDATISLAAELGLLSPETGSLSKIGVAATDPRRFPQIVANRTSALLKKRGIPRDSIKNAIRDLLHSNPPQLPTVDAVWSCFPGAELDLTKFARLLRILADAGTIGASQKRIYLP